MNSDDFKEVLEKEIDDLTKEYTPEFLQKESMKAITILGMSSDEQTRQIIKLTDRVNSLTKEYFYLMIFNLALLVFTGLLITGVL